MNKFYNLIKQGKQGDLYLYNAIGTQIEDNEHSSETIRKDIESLGDIDTLNIYINSPGGDVFEGMTIYNYLQRKKQSCKIIAYIDGLCASIATIIASACDEIKINKGAMFMIHRASSLAWGNTDEMQKQIETLKKIDNQMLKIYSSRNKALNETEIEKYMIGSGDGTWFTAEEAVKYGFCDNLIEIQKHIVAKWTAKDLPKNAPKQVKKLIIEDKTMSNEDKFTVAMNDLKELLSVQAKQNINIANLMNEEKLKDEQNELKKEIFRNYVLQRNLSEEEEYLLNVRAKSLGISTDIKHYTQQELLQDSILKGSSILARLATCTFYTHSIEIAKLLYNTTNNDIEVADEILDMSSNQQLLKVFGYIGETNLLNFNPIEMMKNLLNKLIWLKAENELFKGSNNIYKNMKSINGDSLTSSILNGLKTLPPIVLRNTTILLNFDDYVSLVEETKQTNYFNVNTKEFLNVPVHCLETLDRPLIGDFSYLYLNFGAGKFETKRNVLKGVVDVAESFWFSSGCQFPEALITID